MRARVTKTMRTTVVLKDQACSIYSFACHIKFYRILIFAVQCQFLSRLFCFVFYVRRNVEFDCVIVEDDVVRAS